MNDRQPPDSENLLRLCLAAAPQPWRPSVFAKDSGVDRDALDEPLNQLRMAGLVRLTDWEPGVGQGYVPTELGTAVAGDSRRIARILSGSRDAPVVRSAAAASERPNRYTRGEAIRSSVFERHAAPVTRALIALQVIMFAAGLYLALSDKQHKTTLEQYLSSGRSPMMEHLAVSPLSLARGEWWTLITYALVHAGGLHILMNLYAHWAIGPVVEGMLGSVRFLVLWLLSALGGSFAVAIHPQVVTLANGQVVAMNIPTVGSSGAVCGLIGALAAFLALHHADIGHRAASSIRTWLTQTVLTLILISLMPRVSWQGHLGGAVFGFIAGGLLTLHRFGPAVVRGPALLGVIAIPVLAVGYLSESGILRLKSSADEIAVRERADFSDRLRPQIARVETLARQVDEEHIEPLRSVRPEQRDDGSVRTALTALAGLRTDQVGVLRSVDDTGRYQTPKVEAARHAASELLRQRAEATACYEECLRQGANWPLVASADQRTLARDEFTLQHLLNLALESELAYRHALKGF